MTATPSANEFVREHLGWARSRARRARRAGCSWVDPDDVESLATEALWRCHEHNKGADPLCFAGLILRRLLATEADRARARKRRSPLPDTEPDAVPSESRGPHEAAALREELEELGRWLASLDGPERALVRLRFGLDGSGERTWQEVGEAAGVCRTEAGRRGDEVLARLRRAAAGLPVYDAVPLPPPCLACGTFGGAIRRGHTRPTRAGGLCRGCYDRRRKEPRSE